MSAEVSRREVSDWYESRGISVPRRGNLSKRYVDGWNRAHPDRPYVETRKGSTWYGEIQSAFRVSSGGSE